MQVLGNQQSPILILTNDSIPADFGQNYLRFHYSKPLHGTFSGDNFVVKPPELGEDDAPWSITVGEQRWVIRKIHIHAAAEHRIDSEHPKAYEVHLVHSAASDPGATADKLVVGVFIAPVDKADAKPTIRELNKGLSKQAGPAEYTLHPEEFLPDQRSKWFQYQGSLTSDPFTEDVTWIVFGEDASVPLKDFGSIARSAEQPERPVQPMNRRYVLRNVAKKRVGKSV